MFFTSLLLAVLFFFFFFFNDTATTEIYTLSLHDALPISRPPRTPRPTRHRRWQAIAAGARGGDRPAARARAAATGGSRGRAGSARGRREGRARLEARGIAAAEGHRSGTRHRAADGGLLSALRRPARRGGLCGPGAEPFRE